MQHKKRTTSSGAIDVLNQLRQSQLETSDPESVDTKSSRLESYISRSKSEIEKNKTIEASTFPESDNAPVKKPLIIEEIETHLIERWIHKDRPQNELGNIQELAETFLTIGQQQPCILRPYNSGTKKYELIVGERRWRAAELANLKLKAIVCDIDDRAAALIQAVENENREDLSEYAKGMSYADKIEKGLLEQKDLTEILNISRQQVTRLLSYKKIPQALFEAISDFRKVSARTAYELSRLSNKDLKTLEILINLADKIREGSIGANSITKYVEKCLINDKYTLPNNKKVISNDGRHLFTWRLDNNKTPSIHFPQEIVKLINEQKMDIENLTNGITECITKQLTKIALSPRGDN